MFTGFRFIFSVNHASRDELGLPHNWARVKYWLNFNGKLKIPVKPLDKIIVKKCPEIAKLECYSVNPKDDFWEKFPVNPLPEKPVTTVNVEALKGRLKKVEDSLTWAQKYRGEDV